MFYEEDIRMMTNDHLFSALLSLGIKAGPITGSTRLTYERKLARLLEDTCPVTTTPASKFTSLSNSTPHHYYRTMIPDVKSMNNDELATALRNSGARVGPITDTTRLVYERKLVRLLQDVPPSTSTEQLEESENEEEETVSQFTVEEKSSERPRELSTKVTRSISRRSRRDASPPPNDVSPDKPQTNQKKGGKTPKLSSKTELPHLVLEKVKLQKQPIQNSIETKIPEPKSLPKSKLKSNIPRSSHSDISNSTMVYPDLKKHQKKKRSFGLGDSFYIQAESNAKESYSGEEQVNHPNFVPPYDENQDVNDTDSDESLDSPQELDSDNKFADNPYNDNYDDHHFTVENMPMTNVEYYPSSYNFTQETNSSKTVCHTNEPIQQHEKFNSYIPRWSDEQKTFHVFKKPSESEHSPVGQVAPSKKSNSIWKLDPVEEQNIHRELNDSKNDLAYSQSVKYDCLPKAFRDKYGEYMKVSGTNNSEVRNRRSTDSLPFQSHQKQAKHTNSDSVAQVKAKKLTSAYQRFTSPLASKISSANPTFTPSYIGTPGNSQLNTSLTRRPLSSMREEVKFTSLRKSEATPVSANAAPKKGISIMVKLLVLIVFGVIAWLIYINFEFAHTKPLLTTNQ